MKVMLKGYAATKPGKGKKLNPNSANVKKYSAYLEKKQNKVISSVGANKVYSYRYALNGFAARMTAKEAGQLKRNPDVLNVWKDEIRHLQTDTSPTYIGLTEGGQAWSKGLTGENVVIGIVDTGIWPEHPSFADVKTPKKGNKGTKCGVWTIWMISTPAVAISATRLQIRRCSILMQQQIACSPLLQLGFFHCPRCRQSMRW